MIIERSRNHDDVSGEASLCGQAVVPGADVHEHCAEADGGDIEGAIIALRVGQEQGVISAKSVWEQSVGGKKSL